jgi:hypothetical protein
VRKIREGEGGGSKTTRKVASRERSIVASEHGPRKRLIRAYPPGLATNQTLSLNSKLKRDLL